MHLRDLVKQRWTEAGLYSSKNARLKSYLKRVEIPLQSWEEYATLLRRDYGDLFDLLVPPLLASDDKLLRVTILRHTDLSRPNELAAVRRFLAHADPVADRPEINELLARDSIALNEDFRTRPELVESDPVMLVRKPTNMPDPKAAGDTKPVANEKSRRNPRAPRKRK